MASDKKTFTGLSGAELEILLMLIKGVGEVIRAAKAKGVDLEKLLAKARAENEFGINDVLNQD